MNDAKLQTHLAWLDLQYDSQDDRPAKIKMIREIKKDLIAGTNYKAFIESFIEEIAKKDGTAFAVMEMKKTMKAIEAGKMT